MSVKDKFSEIEILQMEELTKELLKINQELNAMVIGFDAKLKNEEAKVRRLEAILRDNGIVVKPVFKTDNGMDMIKSTIEI
jgi:predicted nuclease with RNAse H fold